jgi:hypothetical protein
MTAELPPPLAHYFAAENRHDIGAALDAFSETASVRDEPYLYPAVPRSAWMEETTRNIVTPPRSRTSRPTATGRASPRSSPAIFPAVR